MAGKVLGVTVNRRQEAQEGVRCCRPGSVMREWAKPARAGHSQGGLVWMRASAEEQVLGESQGALDSFEE